jgi:hypothetical protein
MQVHAGGTVRRLELDHGHGRIVAMARSHSAVPGTMMKMRSI